MMRRLVLLAAVFLSVARSAGPPWDKLPEEWTSEDVVRILRDSPWSPSKFSLDAKFTERHPDPLTRIAQDSEVPSSQGTVGRVEFTRAHPLPAVTVLWRSARTMRLAEAKRMELENRKPGRVAPGELPDYVLSVEGDEPLRILRGAKEDLHDTVFLELESGGTLDFTTVEFLEGPDAEGVRAEFHFPRGLDGPPAVDPESQRVVFHCRATAKKEAAGRANALAFRVEFRPRAMKVRGKPDL
jgi:hypothetical protein